MEIAAGLDGKRLFIAGSCNYSGGLFALDLSLFQVRILAPQRSQICGERVIVASADDLSVIDPRAGFVNAAGHVEREVSLGGEVLVDGMRVAPP
jgi:hypothetical protein